MGQIAGIHRTWKLSTGIIIKSFARTRRHASAGFIRLQRSRAPNQIQSNQNHQIGTDTHDRMTFICMVQQMGQVNPIRKILRTGFFYLMARRGFPEPRTELKFIQFYMELPYKN